MFYAVMEITALLEIVDVSRHFDDFVALDKVSLRIEAGEFFTLLGPSGCGKTTLLRLLAGFDQPDGGDILLDDKSIISAPPEQRPLHTIFQNYALFPHMTVAENIGFPLRMAGCAKKDIQARVSEALENVRLPDKARHYPDALSGGQKQRIAIARALVNRPRLLLLDEPLSALDAKLREQMQIELINLQKDIGITFIYVTHDQGEALALSHRIAVMDQGRIVQVDVPERLYGFPNSRFVADFIGKCNLLEGNVREQQGNSVTVELDGLGPVHVCRSETKCVAGSRCALTLRPEKIRIAANVSPTEDESHFSGSVHDMLYLGDVTVYIVALSNGLLLEALLANSASGRTNFFEVGDSVEVAWSCDAGHLVLE
ncbi:MAG: ABC transporter ATP-binding protein [Desulfobacteraceae bacterium]|nr:ABC transporter ATP-binding protein [Desulfobacteraceae bacterium]